MPLASCRDCLTVAVAFQVVLDLRRAIVVIPQNIAVAVNHSCERCLTYALAIQLIATLTDMPSDEAVEDIERIWQRVEELGENIQAIPLDELHERPAVLEAAILEFS